VKLSIIIVHYNTTDLLRNCLKSIYRQDYNFEYEVVVVDNASESLCGIEENFSQAQIIRNNINLGFARANNQGLKNARGKYILFLNPDTEVNKDSLEEMLKFMENNPDVGLVGPKLLYPDGLLQLSCRKFHSVRSILLRRIPLIRPLFSPKILDEHLMSDWGHDSVRQVDWLLAACMMVPRKIIEEINGFDECYRLYFEDVDLCYRIKQHGLKIIYYPRAVVIHHHRRESAEKFSKKTIWHIQSAIRFFNKFGWKI
jgi:GT2 family glycosyltransferase